MEGPPPPRPLLAAALALAAGSLSAAAGPHARPGDRAEARPLAVLLGGGALLAARALAPAARASVAALGVAGAVRGTTTGATAGAPTAAGTLDPTGADAAAHGSLAPARGAPARRGERWRLAGAPPVELARGLARAGDFVTVAPGARVVRPAVGPALGPGGAPGVGPWIRPGVGSTVEPGGDAARPVALAPRADELARLASGGGARPGPLAPVVASLAAARERGLARLADMAVPGDPLAPASRRAGLLAALLFGARAGLDRETTDLFTRTGTRHLLALSGLHVGLVAVLLGLPLARALEALLRAAAGALPRRRNGAVRTGRLPTGGAFLAAAALAYVPLAGSGAPAARAALAVALAALAGLVAGGRRPDGRSLWGAALLLEVLADPRAPLDVGLQLSYGATFALLVAASPTIAALGCALPNRGRVAEVDRAGRRRAAAWRAPADRLARTAVAAVAVGVVATIATLPLTWAHFGEWSPVGIVATPLVLPLVAAALVLGYGWLALPALLPSAPAEWALVGVVRVLEVSDRWPLTPGPLPPRPYAWLLVAATLSLAALARRSRALGAAALASTLALLFPRPAPPSGLELVALDVGSGSAFLLRAPGEGIWIFDAGSRDRVGVARRAAAPLLRAWGARDLRIVLSHGDADHGGALPWLAHRWPPRLWAGAPPASAVRPGESVAFAAAAARIDLGRGRVELPTRGAREPRGRGLRLELVRARDEVGNQGSRSLVVRYAGRALLLSGDADAHGLADSLAAGLCDPPRGSSGFDLVTLPHHGTAARHLGALLDRARPARVWVSAGRPPPALPEVRRRGLPVAVTALDGPLALVIEPDGRVTTRPSLGVARRPGPR